MSGIKLLLILVIAVLIVVLFKYVQIKRQIRNLSKQMTDLTTGKSEKMLDISLVDKDIEQLAAVLNQYNEKQRQSIASILRHEMYLKESIANISHDLRTPLTVILGHLQLLKKENLSAGQTQRIETIFNKAERMKELIQTFYDLSVIDAKEVTPVREDFNLTNLLINLITENAPALEAKGISPVIGLPDHSVYLHSDYGMVERIFQNLIINAIRYSSGSIKIDLKQGKEKSAIFIIENPIDSKVEIDPNRLFERFYTGDKSRHNSGTGVGLAVVKLLTDKLGGNVFAKIENDTVDTPGNLIDIDANLLQLGGLRPDVAGVHVDDIPVNQHFPGIGGKVFRMELGHFLLDQGPFFRRHRDAQHKVSCSVCHSFTVLSEQGFGDFPNKQPATARRDRGGPVFGSVATLPMLATFLFLRY